MSSELTALSIVLACSVSGLVFVCCYIAIHLGRVQASYLQSIENLMSRYADSVTELAVLGHGDEGLRAHVARSRNTGVAERLNREIPEAPTQSRTGIGAPFDPADVSSAVAIGPPGTGFSAEVPLSHSRGTVKAPSEPRSEA